ncbi:hypothetical protein G6F57_019926 [Rhizopus arrhizus]|nr:hypothetical protein G6F57_019926 [Rhizopus arrhizus]
MGVILTMSLVMMTGLAMTRERERGTMENLLSMPVRPIEVMTGKIPAVGLPGSVAVRRRQPDSGHHAVVAGAEPVAGHAADHVLFPAQHAAVGLHVPVPGHAHVGAVPGQPAAADALQPADSRHPAQRQRLVGPVAQHLAVDAVHRGRHDRRREVLSPNPGLPRHASLSPPAHRFPSRAARSRPP